MTKTNETKTLIVTETVRYEFEVPASMPENDLALKRFFAARRNPWAEADFAAVTERDFVLGMKMDAKETIHSNEFVSSH